jgi:hypothetical protein
MNWTTIVPVRRILWECSKMTSLWTASFCRSEGALFALLVYCNLYRYLGTMEYDLKLESFDADNCKWRSSNWQLPYCKFQLLKVDVFNFILVLDKYKGFQGRSKVKFIVLFQKIGARIPHFYLSTCYFLPKDARSPRKSRTRKSSLLCWNKHIMVIWKVDYD